MENDSKANERGQQALEKLHVDKMHNENERNLHILHRFVLEMDISHWNCFVHLEKRH